MIDYYIYYKVSPETSADAPCDFLPVLIAMQSEILRLTGVRGRLKQKASDLITWMEIYENVHQRLLFDAALAECVERFGVQRFLANGAARRVEAFADPE